MSLVCNGHFQADIVSTKVNAHLSWSLIVDELDNMTKLPKTHYWDH
jgi:hypothetical protein